METIFQAADISNERDINKIELLVFTWNVLNVDYFFKAISNSSTNNI